MQLTRAIIDALLPDGSIWTVEQDAGLDQLLDGMADNHERARAFVGALADLRNPLKTPILDDLEREFGILPDKSVEESVRRSRLLVAKTAGNGDGSLDFLQSRLRTAGFQISVYNNNPAVDPGGLVRHGSSTIMGNSTALFGNIGFGAQTGNLIVNGPITYNQEPVGYPSPLDRGYWPLVSFIAAGVERDDTGAITYLSPAMVPIARQQEFIRLVVKFKPLHSWIGAQVQFV
jgi:hypothetical protein